VALAYRQLLRVPRWSDRQPVDQIIAGLVTGAAIYFVCAAWIVPGIMIVGLGRVLRNSGPPFERSGFRRLLKALFRDD
jgi:hypothetical protein